MSRKAWEVTKDIRLAYETSARQRLAEARSSVYAALGFAEQAENSDLIYECEAILAKFKEMLSGN